MRPNVVGGSESAYSSASLAPGVFRDDDPPAPSWIRALSLLENPFFTREARALGRREYGTLLTWLFYQGLLLSLPLIILEHLLVNLGPLPLGRAAALMLLAAVHYFSCYVTGLAMGQRIFQAERDQGTLDSLRIIGMPLRRWLPLKLVFPVFGVLVVWAAGLPSYLALVLRGHFSHSDLVPGAILVLCGGLVSLCQALLSPVDPPPAGSGRSGAAVLSRVREAVPGLAAWVALCCWFGIVGWVPAVAGERGQAFRGKLFFGWYLRTDHDLVVLLGLLLLAAVFSGYVIANPLGVRAQRYALWARRAAVVGAWVLFLGRVYPGIPAVLRLPLAAVLVFFVLLHVLRSRLPTSNPRAARGALPDWVGARWDEPVLVRDLRVHLSKRPMLLWLFGRTGWQMAALLLVAGLTYLPWLAALTRLVLIFGARWTDPLSRAMLLATVFAPMLLFWNCLAPGIAARRLWLAERYAGTLTQVLSSPLSTRQLVRGRLLSGVLLTADSLAAGLLLGAIGLFWIATRNPEALLPYAALLALCGALALAITPDGGSPALRQSTAQQIAYSLWLVPGMAAAAMLGVAILRGNLGSASTRALTVVAIAFLPLGAALATWVYRRTVDQVEWMRQSDLE